MKIARIIVDLISGQSRQFYGHGCQKRVGDDLVLDEEATVKEAWRTIRHALERPKGQGWLQSCELVMEPFDTIFGRPAGLFRVDAIIGITVESVDPDRLGL